MTVPFGRKISFLISLTQTPLKMFSFISQKILMIFFSHRPQIFVFSVHFPHFPQQNPLFLPYLFLFIPQKFWLFVYFLPPSTPSPYIHHCKNTLSSLHIFVHHCTFCASLHVKTCPDGTLKQHYDHKKYKTTSSIVHYVTVR